MPQKGTRDCLAAGRYFENFGIVGGVILFLRVELLIVKGTRGFFLAARWYFKNCGFVGFFF